MNPQKELYELIIKANAGQEEHQLYQQTNESIKSVNQIVEIMKNSMSEQNSEFYNSELERFNAQSEKLHVQLKSLPNEEALESKDSKVASDYLQMVEDANKDNVYQDVIFEIDMATKIGAESLKLIVDKLNREKGNISILHESENSNHFLLAMPSSKYKKFNELILKDHVESKYDIRGERRYHMFLNDGLSSEQLRDKFKSALSRGEDPIDLLGNEIGIVSTEMSRSNYNLDNNLKNSSEKIFSQIRDMSLEEPRKTFTKGVYFMYAENSPLEIAKRELAKYDEPKNESSLKQKTSRSTKPV